MKEKTLLAQRRELFSEELLGKVTNAGRIYRKIISQDKEFIRLLNSFAEKKREDLSKYAKTTPEKREWIMGCRDGFRQLISKARELAGEYK